MMLRIMPPQSMFCLYRNVICLSMVDFSYELRMCRTFLFSLFLILFDAAFCVGSQNAVCLGEQVIFPHNAAVHIVSIPSCDIERRTLQKASEYFSSVTGKPCSIVDHIEDVPPASNAIVICNNNIKWPFDATVQFQSPEGFYLKTGILKDHGIAAIMGSTEKGLKRGLQRLIILSQQKPEELIIPQLDIKTSPWIAKREWTLCPWEPTRVRGAFRNTDVDPRFDIYSYSHARLEKYIEMMDWFGFSGCQLTETCAQYAAFGQIDSAQDWLGQAMGIIKEQGQDVSLWVWAANFYGFGWRDQDSIYHVKEGQRAFQDPHIRSIFERYYDGYVKHADKIDRLFGHFFDPGELKDREDVFDFMRLLEAKAKAKNPNIQMGVGTWAAGEGFFQAFVDNQFKDYLLLAASIPIMYHGNAREIQHQTAKDLNLELGYWGWYQTEMETDQMPSLFVNAKLLKEFYNRLRKGALSIHPVHYYSEMDAHHLNNIYSMYAAAQLLWDPDRDPNEILSELTEAIWGPRNGPVVLSALQLIQDVRTGPTWETYWWTSPQYRLGSENPQADLQRTVACIDALCKMKPDKSFVPKLPLPFPPETFVELMMPHLKQIREFSEFRIKIAKIHEAAQAGTEKEQLQKMLQDAWTPVREYSTWIGTFGSPELRMQYQTILNIEKQYGIEVSDPSWLVYKQAGRVLQQFHKRQAAQRERAELGISDLTSEFFWPQELSADRIQWLVDQKLIMKSQANKYYLADWENWQSSQ